MRQRSAWQFRRSSDQRCCAVYVLELRPQRGPGELAGRFAPNSGTNTQTLTRLCGGNAAAYANFDPATIITRHGSYQGVSGWFAISGNPSAQRTPPRTAPSPGDPTGAANALCGVGS